MDWMRTLSGCPPALFLLKEDAVKVARWMLACYNRSMQTSKSQSIGQTHASACHAAGLPLLANALRTLLIRNGVLSEPTSALPAVCAAMAETLFPRCGLIEVVKGMRKLETDSLRA